MSEKRTSPTLTEVTRNATTTVKQGVESAQANAASGMQTAMHKTEQMLGFSQANMEALMKSNQLWAAGLQDLARSFATAAQARIESTMAGMKALSGAKSLQEAIALQSTLARDALESAVAETGKLTEASIVLAQRAMAPLVAHMTHAIEKTTHPTA